MTTFETIVVERPEPRIARIVMNRPEARNAQNLQMTYGQGHHPRRQRPPLFVGA
jgi:enoyl-CoA hydratase/carnithine racemase